ncbi:MAG: N-acetyl-gamma-glutamyl-phosphate reductase [Chloroflexi bacterium]|nr:N-acetyl-gamma-glutamyl-phosphate reductase [Chloroflexota bacterium]
MVKVGIINVTGYAGAELARLLAKHPQVKIASVTGRSAVDQPLGEVFPHLAEMGLTIQPHVDDVEMAFSALPHKASAEAIAPLIEKGVRVVDISADFRFKSAEDYPRWYDFHHPAPYLLTEAVYGLTELRRPQVAAARLVANPGCYPTGAILALAPAVKGGLIGGDIIVDSKSGVSGAGRSLSLTTHYCEVNENTQAYALEGHRHLPEIVQELAALNPALSPRVTFVPHLIPMTRGILTTCYAPVAEGVVPINPKGEAEIIEEYRSFYRDEPFVRVVNAPPQTKHTWGNNACLIYPTLDQRTGRLIVISCLDNLVKGAAGQAIQNMNLMLGLPETMGLEALPVCP